MPRRPGSYTTHGKTKVARLRAARDLSLRDAAYLLQIESSTLWRLEHGKIESPRLSWLVNAAMLYGVSMDEVIEEKWLIAKRPRFVPQNGTERSYWGESASSEPKPLDLEAGKPVPLDRS